MKINSYEITDFLKQLSLLTNSGLPLPEALIQLSKENRGKKFKDLILKLGDSTEKGKTLSQALEEHSDTFPQFYVRMIALAEREGALSETLNELACISRYQYMLVNMIRDVMLYPLITIGVSFIILAFLSSYVIPVFGEIFNEMLEGEPLPRLTTLVLSVANFINYYFYEFCLFYILLAISIIWLFCNNGLGNRILLRMSKAIPFSEVIFYNFGMARICSLWATMIRHKVPIEEAFPTIADVMEINELKTALNNVARKCIKGEDFKSCLQTEGNISRLLIMVTNNTTEDNMPEELDRLAVLFKERASYGYRKVGITWETISLGVMTFIVASIILFIFTPFLNILRMF